MIEVAREVARALKGREPVVALETTLVAHGFPAGEGLAVGLASAQAVRDAGAVPATVGVLDGTLRIGLSDSELERFKPRDPSNHLDGLWQYLYPSRPTT